MSKNITLTPRERQVAELAATGLTNLEIAGRLSINIETVKAHMWHVLHKLGAGNRHQIRELLKSDRRKQDTGFSEDEVVEILWGIHALALRKGSPGTAKIINRALIRIRMHPNGDKR